MKNMAERIGPMYLTPQEEKALNRSSPFSGLYALGLFLGTLLVTDHVANSVKIAQRGEKNASIELQTPAQSNALQRFVKNYDTITVRENGSYILKARDTDGNGTLDVIELALDRDVSKSEYNDLARLESLRKEMLPQAR
jgi:hypothetical protein